MKNSFFLIAASFLFCTSIFSQAIHQGSKSWNDHFQNSSSVQNGNDTLATIYDTTACGLNFTQVSVKLGMRFWLLNSPSVAQPAPFQVNYIPYCAQIDKAYLWFVTAGNGMNDTITITNPLGGTQTYIASPVGQAADMCWGYVGTYTYRVDVTSIINGNGNYMVSGIFTNPPYSGNDANGATLFIIYNDLCATYTGSIHINDGTIVTQGADLYDTITGYNFCANSSLAEAFMIVADLQNMVTSIQMNNGTSFTVNEDWWNFISQYTTVMQGQDSCAFTLNHSADCYCLAVAGIYSQTSCNTCIASVNNFGNSISSFTILPNPGDGNFQLTISLSTAQEISMNVFDNVGRTVYSENKNAAAGNFISTMDLTSLSAGVYFVQVKTANGVGTKRLVIE